MKENSEILAQQARSAGTQVGSGPTIELVTRIDIRSQCDPVCPPVNCPPPCRPIPCPPNECYPMCPPPCQPVSPPR